MTVSVDGKLIGVLDRDKENYTCEEMTQNIRDIFKIISQIIPR